MNINQIESMSERNWNYIINGRRGAIAITKERIVVADKHIDCIDIIFDELSERKLEEVEINVYNKRTDISIVIGDLYEKVIVLYYYDNINDIEIYRRIKEYCKKNNLKLFLDGRTVINKLS